MRRPPLAIAVAVVLLPLVHVMTAAASPGDVCDPTAADSAAVALARADVAATCNCTGTASHSDYTQCARTVLQARIDAHRLSAECGRFVRHCASHSTCGRPTAVTCCRTSASGRTRCHIKHDASRCKIPPGGAACVGLYQSCCDACTATGCAPPPTPSPTPSPGPTPTSCGGLCPGGIQTVFIILMENHNWADVKNGPSAPYIDGTLVPAGAHAEQYFNPPGVHPSEPNYLWLEAGTSFGVTNDALPSTNHQSTTQHLVTLLNDAGISWTSYQEDIVGNACPLTGVASYAPKHNPMVFFDDVTDTRDPQSATCIAHNRPYTELATNLQNGTVTRYNFITPNQCNDMHNKCAPQNDQIRQGDDWLSTAIPMIQSSIAYQNNGVILITWDEGEFGSDGPIGMIVLSPFAKVGYSNSIPYTHSSTLRSMQEIFSVVPLIRDAANATDLSDLFTTFP